MNQEMSREEIQKKVRVFIKELQEDSIDMDLDKMESFRAKMHDHWSSLFKVRGLASDNHMVVSINRGMVNIRQEHLFYIHDKPLSEAKILDFYYMEFLQWKRENEIMH